MRCSRCHGCLAVTKDEARCINCGCHLTYEQLLAWLNQLLTGEVVVRLPDMAVLRRGGRTSKWTPEERRERNRVYMREYMRRRSAAKKKEREAACQTNS